MDKLYEPSGSRSELLGALLPGPDTAPSAQVRLRSLGYLRQGLST